jgi:maltose phosphorylase
MKKNLFDIHPWKITEHAFDPEKQLQAESIFSIGNGAFGQRANFEESYSGKSLRGSYIGGVYYPDKTRVGWWKNGYPDYFAKVLNAPNWIGMDVLVDGVVIDLAHQPLLEFYRELDMQTGMLTRSCVLLLEGNKKLQLRSRRFCSMHNDTIAAIEYAVTPLNFDADLSISAYVDGRVSNHDAHFQEYFWEPESSYMEQQVGYLAMKTRKTGFLTAHAMHVQLQDHRGQALTPALSHHDDKEIRVTYTPHSPAGHTTTLYKYVAITSSFLLPESEVISAACHAANEAAHIGFSGLQQQHAEAWQGIWKKADIVIEGDEAAQQGIRFAIYHLYQTYTGKYPGLNIGPKGFTGEKYGGATYWDTEAYCLPFYLKTAGPQVAKQLLNYRFLQLNKAIENAQKLGFDNGAALYPMVTMNGEECHNEWEITFEEIHRNGAIAYAIYNYVKHTGDHPYLYRQGLPVLIAIARFWAQRVNWSDHKKAYVILGVTGPNEYENNVNNNWYTNFIAKWCLTYTLECLQAVSDDNDVPQDERLRWSQIADHMYLPVLEGTRVFLQQDGFLDKVLANASDIPEQERPINKHWSWDRILRSVFIKQADVLQGLYFFENLFDIETIRENFEFYEPKTVHESSLSPCIHAVLAARLGMKAKSYEMYLRTSRLDLDDYNHEADEGLHITSMAGTWMSIVEGLAGVRVDHDRLIINPLIPDTWKSLSFQMPFRSQPLECIITPHILQITHHGDQAVEVHVGHQVYTIMPGDICAITYNP